MTRASFVLVFIACLAVPAFAQLVPEIGYVHPAGGQAGTTIDVVLGGYDWSPDMQLFAHDERIRMELTGPPTPVLVPEPPYWFGAKARGPAWPLPREFPARITIAADVPPGIVKWQAANANGASPVGYLHIGSGTQITEDPRRTAAPQLLPSLPVTVSGQIRKIEEIDRYAWEATQSGPVTISLLAKKLGSPLHGMLQVQDSSGKVILDLADTLGRDLVATFAATQGMTYLISLHDLDFAGDRSYVYRLSLSDEPRVVAAFPAQGKRGTTQAVEFLGWGLATGSAQLESVTREVTFPADQTATSLIYRVETPAGPSEPWNLLVGDEADWVEPPKTRNSTLPQLPITVSGSLEQPFEADVYQVSMTKDAKFRITAEARRWESPLDVELTIVGPDGKELMTQDDAPTTTDASLLFTCPADATYQIVIADRAGSRSGRAGFYRLRIAPELAEFSATVPPTLNLPIGTKGKLTIPLTRSGGFNEAVNITLTGLPAGVKPLGELVIPSGKNELSVELECAADAPAQAALCQVVATTKMGEADLTQPLGKVLIATTLKPRIKITPEGLDDVRKVARGSTFLAPLHLEWLEGYNGPVTLEMTSKQQRHRQGLSSDEFVVEPGMKRVEYPIFVPEWMETTKTSRMILNGTVQVPDPQGNVRTLVQRMELRIGMLPVGALLRVTHAAKEPRVQPGEVLSIPVKISRAPELREPVRLEVRSADPFAPPLESPTVELAADQSEATLQVRLPASAGSGEQTWVIRATAQQNGRWPVVSETEVVVMTP